MFSFFCLLTLLLNDHYLKYEFSSWATGKLSDMVGIIILPLLLAFIFPKLKEHAALISALLFTFWKSPLSQNIIDLYNRFSFIQTSRIIDFTDLYVLILLPFPHFIIKRIDTLDFLKITKVNPLLINSVSNDPDAYWRLPHGQAIIIQAILKVIWHAINAT